MATAKLAACTGGAGIAAKHDGRRCLGSAWQPPFRQTQPARLPPLFASSGDQAVSAAPPTLQQQQQQQQPPPPPYTQLSTPVYSLATAGPDGGCPTMNLVTYAAPVSLKPRHYALGLYMNTLSWHNMLATRVGVLQILGEQHAALFELLGRTSGRDVDKLAELSSRGFATTRRTCDGVPLLDDSLGWMELRFAGEPVSHGDHDVVICEVTDWHSPAVTAGVQPPHPLYTGRLRELGLM